MTRISHFYFLFCFFKILQADGDVLPEELNDIWNSASKFPEVDTSKDARIDVDSFVQIYRDVDDLFEDDGEDNDNEIAGETSNDDNNTILDTSSATDDDDDDDDVIEEELSVVYESICNDLGLVSKDSLKQWEEIQKLLVEGLLGEDEFDDLWEKTPKSPGTKDEFLDVEGFQSFNVALDGLFEFEDDDEDDDNDGFSDEEGTSAVEKRSMVVEGDMPPGVLFAELANKDYLVGMEELKLWVELQDMIDEGDLLPSELQEMYNKYVSTESNEKLTEEAFLKLYDEIDALFEGEDVASVDETVNVSGSQPQGDAVKKDLLAFLDIIEDGNEEMLPCGLDATEADQKQIVNIVNVLQQQPTNMIQQKQGNIGLSDVVGTWELIYCSSSAMKFNKGLSGLGGSFPNGRFAGFKQELKTTKFLNDMEYKERIEVNPSSASFDVTVTGSWDLRTSVSLFTGQPLIVLNVEPERVNYGPTSTRADHWKSLGPLNMLDLSYLDEDLRIMRGCTSSDTLFIFKKVT